MSIGNLGTKTTKLNVILAFKKVIIIMKSRKMEKNKKKLGITRYYVNPAEHMGAKKYISLKKHISAHLKIVGS